MAEQALRNPSAPTRRIGNLTAFFMLLFAGLFDATQFLLLFLNVLPVIGTMLSVMMSVFVTLLATCVFGLWFLFHRVNYFRGRMAVLKALAILGSVSIEIVPFLDALPGILSGVLAIVVLTYLEDTMPAAPTSRQ